MIHLLFWRIGWKPADRRMPSGTITWRRLFWCFWWIESIEPAAPPEDTKP